MNKNIFIPIVKFVKNTFPKNKENYNILLVKNQKKQHQIMIKKQFHSLHNPPPLPPDILLLALGVCFIYYVNR
jgi:hypothetical protein